MKQGNYDKLNDKGIAPEETVLDSDDIIIGKISPIQPTGNNNKVYKDNSTSFKSNVEGVIDRVHTGIYNAEGYEMYNVRVRMEREPMSGDKFTCYDDSHEVLTTDGWINIKDVSKEHKVASLEYNEKDKTHILKYVNPTEVQSYDYKGPMYLVESNQVSLCVTPNHRMWVGNRESKYKAELAQDILGKRKYYKKNVDDVYINKNEKYLVYDDDYSAITHFKLGDMLIDIIDWVRFFGIWIAEGFTHNNLPEFTAHKQRVKDELDRVATKYNWKYTKSKSSTSEDGGNHIWSLRNKIIGKYLNKLSVGAVNKYLPKWVWCLTPDICKELINGMMLGDGHTMDNGTRRYDTSSVKLADDFQRLCLHAGFSTNISVKYEAGHSATIKNGSRKGTKITSTCDALRMTIIESQNEPLVNKEVNKGKQLDKMIDFDGKVYCCTVGGTGVIYVRRNKMPVWCGNSNHGQKGTVGITYKQKDMPFTESGMVPDLILNPHGYPSRMSLGHFIECLASKEAAETGHFVDGTPFNNYDINSVSELMVKLGYSAFGTEKMYCGITGRKMDVQIFIGPVFTIRLKHMVLDKVHGRARGPRQALTRQPLEGRSRDGGLKIGNVILFCLKVCMQIRASLCMEGDIFLLREKPVNSLILSLVRNH